MSNVDTSDQNMASVEEEPAEESEESESEHLQLSCPVANSDELRNRLRNFKVLDDLVNAEDDDDDAQDSDSDVPAEEIEAMLEEGLPEEFKGRKRKRVEPEEADANTTQTEDDQGYDEKEKVILVEKGINHLEVLPEGWICVTHCSGMPVYLHRASRVVTLSKPYFIGAASLKRHDIPLSGIPCLKYLRELDREAEEKQKQQEQKENDPAAGANKGLTPIEPVRIETVAENKESYTLTPEQVNEYCQRRFTFKTVKIPRFRSWESLRKHMKERRKRDKLSRLPSLPENTKLIHMPVYVSDENGGQKSKEFILNPEGKSYSCILHEYLQRCFRTKPDYVFNELENAATPFQATIRINDLVYGTGYGSSKKIAKMEAARATLEILMPKAKDKFAPKDEKKSKKEIEERDLSFFDDIKIDDPRVAELCTKTSEPAPFSILLTCLQKNFGFGPVSIKLDMKAVRRRQSEYSMRVGKHSATVTCRNKREGKQLASQVILQALHPNLTTWGSLLRLYGRASYLPIMERKMERNDVTQLQRKSTSSPNHAILAKLKEEMLKLKELKESVQPISTFTLPADIELPEHSGVDLDNIDLQ